ncbi:MAG: hypothetical protein ACXACK_07430 [Candidatus Hodarchaeales archaeon]
MKNKIFTIVESNTTLIWIVPVVLMTDFTPITEAQLMFVIIITGDII